MYQIFIVLLFLHFDSSASILIMPVFDETFGRFLDFEKSQGFEILTQPGIFTAPVGDEKLISLMLRQIDLIAKIDASHDSYKNYSGGIYYEPNCSNNKQSLTRHVIIKSEGVDKKTGTEFWIICDAMQPKNWGVNIFEINTQDYLNYREVPDINGCMHLIKRDNHCGIATEARTALGAGRIWHMTINGQIAVPKTFPFTFMTPQDMWWAIHKWEIEVEQPKKEYGGPIFVHPDGISMRNREGEIIAEKAWEDVNWDAILKNSKEKQKQNEKEKMDAKKDDHTEL